MTERVPIRRLPTGVPGLDDILGGGLPEFSFNLIVGAPGTGKTTLAHQIIFASATRERPGLFFTLMGEPPLKMLRYQQQFNFFDVKKLNESIRFVSMAQEVRTGGLAEVLKRITREVESTSAAMVMVDSFRSIIQAARGGTAGQPDFQDFVHELGIRLTGSEATTFLVGEYQPSENESNPVFTVADGLISLYQTVDRDSMVRKIKIEKMRGQATIPGLHTFRITDGGLQVFPRTIVSPGEEVRPPAAHASGPVRLSTGLDALDEMLGGGVPAGYSVLLAGPSGSGKTLLATEFICSGARGGEPGVIAVFEKRPRENSSSAATELNAFVRDGRVGLIHTRPLDLSIDETLHELTTMIGRLKAKRVVIDSLSGFELALAPTFREDFRESLYRMVTALTSMGVTVLMTAELENRYTDLRFSPHDTAFLTDAIILQRYLELGGQLRRMMTVVKLRGSAHSKDLRLYEIADDGLSVGASLAEYERLLLGDPRPRSTPLTEVP
ncbi:MAG: AAA family ATPase [Luteitalea sp.]|nr:AAA family ATPase [Luteitalea sp.]